MLSKLIRPFSVLGNQNVTINFLKPLTGLDLANIRLTLSAITRSPPSPLGGFDVQGVRHAAVLIALCNMAGEEPGVILTVRSQNMRNHPGEISLPGGHQDTQIDQSVLSTALRETYEEIGLIPGQLEFLGALNPVVDNSGHILVWPHVVFVHSLENTVASTTGPGPMIPRLMSQLGNEPLKPLRLQNLQGKHQVAEVDVVFQIPFTTLLNSKRQIQSYFRNDTQKPYLEWFIKQEVLAARAINGIASETQRQVNKGSKSFRLWGLSGWIIQLAHSFKRHTLCDLNSIRSLAESGIKFGHPTQTVKTPLVALIIQLYDSISSIIHHQFRKSCRAPEKF